MSHQLYKQDLNSRKIAQQRLEKENTKSDHVDAAINQVLKDEEELLMNQKDLQRQLTEASSIITDGSERLQVAIKKKDNLDIDRATILIDGGNIKSKTISEQLSKVTEDLIKIQKKRKDIFRQQQKKRQKTSTNPEISFD